MRHVSLFGIMGSGLGAVVGLYFVLDGLILESVAVAFSGALIGAGLGAWWDFWEIED